MAVGRYLSPPFTMWRFSGSYVVVGTRLNNDTRKRGVSSRIRDHRDALADADRKSARCGYAQQAAADVAATAQTLLDAWSADGGNFIAELSNAGESGGSFGSAQVALNVVSDAMFFFDSATKDVKLAESAGITDNSCGTNCLR